MGKFKLLLLVLFAFQFFLLSDITYAVPPTSPKKGAGETAQPTVTEYCGSNTACLQNYWKKIQELGISWIYNWDRVEWNGTGRPEWMSTEGNTIEYVPMIQGGGVGQIGPRTSTPTELDNFARYASNHPGSSFLIWNEPELVTGSAIIAASVYDSIRNAIKNADPTAKLIVGNVSNYDRVWWLNNFRTAYRNLSTNTTHANPVVEGWGGHLYKDRWQYGSSDSYQIWRNDINKYREWMVSIGDCTTTTCSKEFWLTEFGSLSSNGTGMQIMNDQLPWLEEPAQSWITRYAWFHVGPYHNIEWNINWSGNLISNSIKDMTVDLSVLGVRYATNSSSIFYHYPCPTYAVCVNESTACPNGKYYDRRADCSDGVRCCNPRLPPPTPTPTSIPTPSTSKGWNKLTLTASLSSSSFSSCRITENRTSFWHSFVIGQLQNKTYFLNCR